MRAKAFAVQLLQADDGVGTGGEVVARDLDAATKIIVGSARSMGLEVTE